MAHHARHLKNGHLRGGVLHRHAVGLEVEVALACRRGSTRPRFHIHRRFMCRCMPPNITSDDLGVGRVLEMAVHDLLAEGEGAAEALANDGDVLVKPFVVDVFGRLQLAVGNIGER